VLVEIQHFDEFLPTILHFVELQVKLKEGF